MQAETPSSKCGVKHNFLSALKEIVIVLVIVAATDLFTILRRMAWQRDLAEMESQCLFESLVFQ